MPSLYDAIEVRGQLRYRLNKNFIGADKVPENIKAMLTKDNIVDENGLEVVDQKNPEAQAPTEENQEDIDKAEAPNKLQRVDQKETTEQDQPEEEELPPSDTAQPPVAPAIIDDSANDQEEGDEDHVTSTPPENTKDTTAPKAAAAPTPDPEAEDTAPKEKTSRKPRRAPTADEPVEKFKSKVPQSTAGMGFPRKNGKTVDIFDLKTPHTKVMLVGGLTVPLSEESFKAKGENQIRRRLTELGIETIDFDSSEGDIGQAVDSGLLLEDEEEDDIQLG